MLPSAATEFEPNPNAFLRVVAAPHPFKVETLERNDLRVGMTLSEVLDVIQPDQFVQKHCHIFINDYFIPKDRWHVVRPKAGCVISMRVIPHGGGGKNPLRTILSLAVVVAAFAFGPALGAAMIGGASTSILGFTVTAQAIGGAVISAVGTLLVNALAPVRPQSLSGLSQQKESPAYAITGASNQANKFGQVPVILGRHKHFPPYGATPYTEIVGNDQYLRMVFVWGTGPLLIEDLKIGDTPLSQFTDIEYVNRAGWADDPDLTIYTQDVYEETLSTKVSKSGGSVVRNTAPNADEVSLDFAFGFGLVKYSNSGKRTNWSVSFDVEYALVGTEDWQGGAQSFIARTSDALDEVEATRWVLNAGVSPTMAQQYKNQGKAQSFYSTEVPVTNASRIDLITVDPFTGAIGIVKGVTAFDGAEPAIPATPATATPIAKVRRTIGNPITNADITDLRTASSPFDDPLNDFEVTEQTVPDDTVLVGSGAILGGKSQTVTANTAEAYRATVRFRLPTRGQYKVRVTRTTNDSTSDKILDELTWGVLRTFRNEVPFDCTGLATTEIRIKATDQLNQVIDQFSGVVTSIVSDYNYLTGNWEMRPTRNPASLARSVLQGAGNARALPDSRMNVASWEAFHDYCRVNEFNFDMIRDFKSSVWEALTDVCSSAFAAATQVDGKWGVVIDQDKIVPRQHYTPKNTRNFSFERIYPTRPHAWRVRFVNEENDFTQDELIVYDDGYDETTATLYETFEVIGVTNPAQVWRIGRRRIAEARLRCESYTFETDFEHLLCTRGDMVYLTHDVISVGLASGRIKELILDGDDVVGVVVDEKLDVEAGKRYGLAIRGAADGIGMVTREVTASLGEGITSLMFVTPFEIDDPEEDFGPEVGDQYGFGEFGSEFLECIVLAIKPMSEMSAQVRCVPLARPIFSADTGSIPEFTPNITVSAGTVTPFIINLRSDESVLAALPNGLFAPVIRVTFGRFSSTLVNRPLGIEIQYKEQNEAVFRSLFMQKQEIVELDLPDVIQGDTYVIKARYVLSSGVGPFTPEYTHVVVGMATPPPDPSGLVLEGEFLRWTYTDEVPRDFRGFEVRTSTDTTADWDNMILCHDGIVKDAEFSIVNYLRGERVFAVKAIDLAGNYSTNEVRLARDFGDMLVENIVDTIDFEADGWIGTLTGGTISGGDILGDSLSLYLPNGAALYLTNGSDLYLPSQFDQIVYIPPSFKITSDLVPSRLTISEDHEGDLVTYYRFGEDGLYLGGSAYDSELYLPSPDMDDEEYLPPTWASEFRVFPLYVDVAVDDVYQFKAVVDSSEDQNSLNAFAAVFDVEDETESFSALALSSGGTRLPLTKDYRSVKVVNVTLNSGSAATRVVIVDKDAALGPLLQGYDSGGSAAAASVDVIVQGMKG